MAEYIAKLIIILMFAGTCATLWWCFRPTWIVHFSDQIESVRFSAYTSAGLRRQINAYALKNGLGRYKLKRG